MSSKAGSQKALESLSIEEDFGRLEHTRLGDRHHMYMYVYIHVNTHVHTHTRTETHTHTHTPIDS